MASAIVPSQKLPLSASEELKQCICGKPLKEARLLDCLHVIGICCSKAKGKTNVLVCTVCEAVTQVPESDLSLLPEPRFLQVLTATERKQQGKRPLCEQCGTSSHEASGHCEECAEYVCDKAAETHKKLKFTRSHNIVPLTRFQSSSAPNFESMCRAHKQLNKFFCGQCDQLLCYECRYPSHDKHSGIVDLNTKITEVNADLEASKLALAAKTTPLQVTLRGSVEDRGSAVQKAAAEIENKITFFLHKEEYLLLRTQQILEAGSKEERIMLSRLLKKTKRGAPRIITNLPDATLVYLPFADSSTAVIRAQELELEVILALETNTLSDATKKKFMKPGIAVVFQKSLEAVIIQSIENDVAIVSGPNAVTINQKCYCYGTQDMHAQGHKYCPNCGIKWGVALASLRFADRYFPLSEL